MCQTKSLSLSNLLFGSQVWRPSLLKDIKALENIQRRATKFILNDYSSSYRTRLISLHLLPLMMTLEFNDISFFIKCLKQPCKSFDIMSFISFNKNITRSGSCHKRIQPLSKTNRARHIYISIGFHVHGMHYHVPIDLSLTHNTIMSQLNNLFWSHFLNFFSDNNACTFHFCFPCSKCVAVPAKQFFS